VTLAIWLKAICTRRAQWVAAVVASFHFSCQLNWQPWPCLKWCCQFGTECGIACPGPQGASPAHCVHELQVLCTLRGASGSGSGVLP